jgi:hypothetical protein
VGHAVRPLVVATVLALNSQILPQLASTSLTGDDEIGSSSQRDPAFPARSTPHFRGVVAVNPGRRGRGRRREDDGNGNGHGDVPAAGFAPRRLLSLVARTFLPDSLIESYREHRSRRALPPTGATLARRDARWQLNDDPGPEAAVNSALRWLRLAQDRSATADGGIARHYGLMDGWSASYPETTGYIAPTILKEAARAGCEDLFGRARRLLDWLADIQLPNGAFQAGLITTRPVVPVTFNTGQILIGLAEGAAQLGDERYVTAMHRAATWLVRTQDSDGAWRRFPTPLAVAGEKAYETHVAWGLFAAERVAPGHGYGDAGLRQVRWALSKQLPNGWFTDCCLDAPDTPLTHTIGYTLRGIIEAYRLSGDRAYLAAAERAGRALLNCMGPDGRLPGRIDAAWRPAVSWVCLTGSAQIAACWLDLLRWTHDERFLDAARRANQFTRRTQMRDAPEGIAGGIRGAFPCSGAYGRYEFLSWGAKFFIDATREEQAIG